MTTDEVIRRAIKSGAPGLSDLIVGAIVRSAMMKICHHAGVELSEENDRLMEDRAKLRAALQKVADLSDSEAGDPLDEAIDIARKALTESAGQK